ncbi:unnamed protein product [Prunus brigantina]
MGGQRRVTPGRACPRPNGFGRNLRSKTRWFTGFCNSHQMTTPPAHTVSGATGTRSLVQVPWRNSRRCSFVRPEGAGRASAAQPPEIKGRGARRDGPSPPALKLVLGSLR